MHPNRTNKDLSNQNQTPQKYNQEERKQAVKPNTLQDYINPAESTSVSDPKAEHEEIKDPTSPNSLTPKTSLMYSQIYHVDEAAYYKTYEAISKTHNELHPI